MTLITEKDVIPAKAGIQENTGFPVSTGQVVLTNYTGPSLFILFRQLVSLFFITNLLPGGENHEDESSGSLRVRETSSHR